MDFDDVINSRYSVRGFLNKDVEKEKLDYVLNAATVAPTGVNAQAFKVYVIDAKKYKDELKGIYSPDWFTQAPYVLCVVQELDKTWVRKYDNKVISDIDAAIVMTHIVLAAANVGLGTCFIGAFKPQKARIFLDLDDNEEPVLFTPLGYGDSEPRETPRKEIDEFTVYID